MCNSIIFSKYGDEHGGNGSPARNFVVIRLLIVPKLAIGPICCQEEGMETVSSLLVLE